MSDKIYNKNAREKALLEEAYSSVYNEGQFWGRDDLVKKGKEEDKKENLLKTMKIRIFVMSKEIKILIDMKALVTLKLSKEIKILIDMKMKKESFQMIG